MASMVKR